MSFTTNSSSAIFTRDGCALVFDIKINSNIRALYSTSKAWRARSDRTCLLRRSTKTDKLLAPDWLTTLPRDGDRLVLRSGFCVRSSWRRRTKWMKFYYNQIFLISGLQHDFLSTTKTASECIWTLCHSCFFTFFCSADIGCSSRVQIVSRFCTDNLFWSIYKRLLHFFQAADFFRKCWIGETKRTHCYGPTQ